MLKNYFKTAWRNLLKNRFYTLINITGLTAGLSVGILILLWVHDELGFDTFHQKADNIYKLENLVGTGSSKQIWTSTVAPIGPMAKREVAQVTDEVRLFYNNRLALFRYRDKVYNEENTFFTDPSFFSVFDFPLIKGDVRNPFPDDNSVVLTERVAKQYFGSENALGKVIVADDRTNLRVTGIIKNFPENSGINGNMFFPMKLLAKQMYPGSSQENNMDHDFSQFDYSTFLLLQPGTAIPKLETTLREIHLRNKPDDTDLTYLLQPMKKMHLYRSDGSASGITMVRMFTMVALLILCIACVNYVNISTARARLRSKEVSLRKIVGASKWHLFLQFITETTILFLFATALTIGVMILIMPLYNDISGKSLVLDLTSVELWKIIGLTITGTLVASSIYPAIFLSSLEPLHAIKGKISARISDAMFRKGLVITQFVFSIVLITGTIIISNQLQYIRSKELGYDKQHVFSSSLRQMGKHYDAIRAELLQQPGVVGITGAGGNIISMGGQTGNNSWDGKEPGETMMVHPMAIDKDFIPFFKINVLQGSNFNGSKADSAHYIFNEAAVKAARIKDPVGKTFRMWNTTGTIIGVVKDFHFASMKEKIEPAVFYHNPGNIGRIYIKTTGKDADKAIAKLRSKWNQYNAGFPFSYNFLDDNFNALYKSEERTGILFTIFASIAILISCLGLFGLAAFTAQQRTREIGVRKTLGAGVRSIVQLLAKDFIKLVVVAIVIAVPLSWYIMNNWLQNFAYKITIGWSVFVISGSMAIIIAAITVSFQSVKAALVNPIKSLRSE